MCRVGERGSARIALTLMSKSFKTAIHTTYLAMVSPTSLCTDERSFIALRQLKPA